MPKEFRRVSSIPAGWRVLAKLLMLVLALLIFQGCGSDSRPAVDATTPSANPDGGRDAAQKKKQIGADEIDIAVLPPEALQVLRLIQKGGPFPYAQDGTVFANRESLLPKQARGYYHEYTVRTPGAKDRGARRIITGSEGEYYYTDDHYRSFRRIRE
jgi:ribonuclease T1